VKKDPIAVLCILDVYEIQVFASAICAWHGWFYTFITALMPYFWVWYSLVLHD